MINGALSTVLMLALSATVLGAQVPPGYDLSQARPWRTVWKVTIGGFDASAPLLRPNLCGFANHNYFSVATSSGGRAFMTHPRIDTNAPEPKGWGAGYVPIDYDGVPPLEYSDDNGRISRCLGGPDPWVRERIDTIDCWGSGFLSYDFSADVDGDGYLDVVCDIGGGGKAFRVISGGPQAGKGCERVVSIDKPVYGAGIEAFYLSSFGPWRMIMSFRADGEELLVLYDVEITRTSPRGDGLQSVFIPRDTVFGSSREPGSPSSFGNSVVVQDTILKRDYLVLRYKPLYTQWVTERFDLTDGLFNASGERVAGYQEIDFQLGHSLGTSRPVVTLTGRPDEGHMYCYVDDLVHPFSSHTLYGTGAQPAAGYAVINDQTGDGQPDVVWSGGNPAVLVLMTLDSTIVGIEEHEPPQTDFSARLSGMTLTVQATQPCSISIDISSVDGRTLYTSPATAIETGEYRQDLSPLLQPLAAGAYFVRVRCGAQMTTIPITR
jgi:hypothetical protein